MIAAFSIINILQIYYYNFIYTQTHTHKYQVLFALVLFSTGQPVDNKPDEVVLSDNTPLDSKETKGSAKMTLSSTTPASAIPTYEKQPAENAVTKVVPSVNTQHNSKQTNESAKVTISSTTPPSAIPSHDERPSESADTKVVSDNTHDHSKETNESVKVTISSTTPASAIPSHDEQPAKNASAIPSHDEQPSEHADTDVDGVSFYLLFFLFLYKTIVFIFLSIQYCLSYDIDTNPTVIAESFSKI